MAEGDVKLNANFTSEASCIIYNSYWITSVYLYLAETENSRLNLRRAGL